jgi:hypothetical protein
LLRKKPATYTHATIDERCFLYGPCREVISHPVPGGYQYGNLSFQMGGVSNLKEENVVMIPGGLGPENDCAGEDQ